MSNSLASPLIRADKLCFHYSAEPIVNCASFAVSQGDFVCISGPNGAGKSTLLKLMLGLLQPTSGAVTLKNVKAAYVSQNAGSFNPGFPATVEEVVGLGLYGMKLSRTERADRIGEALRQVSMGDKRRSMIGKLSGGQQQRVFIAKALAALPDVIFLDEPTSGVDSASADSICCLLGDLNKQNGITILMVTHDLQSILDHANVILQFSNNGEVQALPAEGYIPGMLGLAPKACRHKEGHGHACL